MKVVLFAVFIIPNIIYAQSNVNPDISLIGTFNSDIIYSKNSPDNGKLIFHSPNMELYVDGYLNPYARGAGNIAYEEGSFSVEELYAEIVRGLPLDVQIKAGKYLLKFGQLNQVHAHVWPFIGRPLYQDIYFGPEGFNDIGFNFSFILPVDFYTTLDLGIFKGDAIGENEIPENGAYESISAFRGDSPIFVGRLGTFFQLSDYGNLAAGISGSYGIHSKMNIYQTGDTLSPGTNKSLAYTYLGLDFKYKYRPDDYTALTIQGEGLLNHRDVMRYGSYGTNTLTQEIKTINTFGAFIYIDYLFEKMYSVGAKYDYTNGIVGDSPAYNTLSNDNKNNTQGITAWFGFYPVEHTLAFRLNLQHLIYHSAQGRSPDPLTNITLQMIFSLGPHKAHPF
jgi:hypothetical protein